MARLQFLNGAWTTMLLKGRVYADLFWSQSKAGSLVGCSRYRSAENGFKTVFSLIIIRPEENGLVLSRKSFVNDLNAEPALEEFSLVSLNKNEVLFEKIDHTIQLTFKRKGSRLEELERETAHPQNPQRIKYSRE